MQTTETGDKTPERVKGAIGEIVDSEPNDWGDLVERPEETAGSDTPEAGEKLNGFGIEMELNREKIGNILADNPGLLRGVHPDTIKGWEKTIETLAALPEKLEFKPGVTLVVGENGSGKSTLTHAMYMVLQAMHVGRDLQGCTGDTLKQFVSENTGVEGVKKAYFLDDISGAMSPLAAALSGCIGVSDESIRMGSYIDFTTLAGRDAGARADAIRNNGVDPFMAVEGFGGFIPDKKGSHGQKSREELNRILVEGNYGGLRVRRSKGGDALTVVFVEEPETGLDPKNHRTMVENLKAMRKTLTDRGEKVVLIVNTNSVLAYEDTGLDRISLWEPRQGIHTPAD